MEPMETIDLNAPGSISDYCRRYGPLYFDIAKQGTPGEWNDALLDKLEHECLGELPADQRLVQLIAHKRNAPQK